MCGGWGRREGEDGGRDVMRRLTMEYVWGGGEWRVWEERVVMTAIS